VEAELGKDLGIKRITKVERFNADISFQENR
jgi:hypothetical protein